MVDLVKRPKNNILIDWLTFSCKDISPEDCMKILGLEKVSWRSEFGSKLRYEKRFVFQHIQIHYTDSKEKKFNEGLCCEISGQGCREFESFSSVSWEYLIYQIRSLDQYNFSRLDLAYDDFSGVLPLDQIVYQAQNFYFTSRSSHLDIMASADNLDSDCIGYSVVHGKRCSNVLIRIYDKRVERKRWDLPHWVRCECQLRSDAALNSIGHCFDSSEIEIGAILAGIVRRYVQYRVPSADSNKSRWTLSPWYEDFCGAVASVSCYTSHNVEYNKHRMDAYAYDQNHNHTLCEIACDGVASYFRRLFSFSDPMPEKYMAVASDVHLLRREQDAKQAARSVFTSGGDCFAAAAAAQGVRARQLPEVGKQSYHDFLISAIADLEKELWLLDQAASPAPIYSEADKLI